ncbi:hypothetical protein ACPA9J_22460 [Pseudomonas aeruginosa]
MFEVVGVDGDAESCRLAVELGVVDVARRIVGRACVGADVIQRGADPGDGAVLADLAKLDLVQGCVDRRWQRQENLAIVRAARVAFGGMPRYLVPGHPIAGSVEPE